MKNLFCLGLLLAGGEVALAATTPDQFAYKYELATDKVSPLYAVNLDERIYRGLVQENHGDIRIFDVQNSIMPHTIRQQQSERIQTQASHNVPYFPVYVHSAADLQSAPDIHINTNTSGAIVDIRYDKTMSADKKIYAYIIDASALQQEVDQLELDWQDSTDNKIVPVSIESSTDLANWRTVVSQASISRIRYNGHLLLKKYIQLPAHQYKYLRLRWSTADNLTISQVSLIQRNEIRSELRHWSSAKATSYNDTDRFYEYDIGMLPPVDRLRINFQQQNGLAKLRLLSAKHPRGPWNERFTGLVYHLTVNGTTLDSSDIHMRLGGDRYWRIQLVEPEATVKPALEFGWLPAQIIFMAQGSPPYNLAYGSARVEAQTASLSTLLNGQNIDDVSKMLQPATLAKPLGEVDKTLLTPAPAPLPWKKWILWAVLLLAVGGLAWMAMQLYKQMDNSAQS